MEPSPQGHMEASPQGHMEAKDSNETQHNQLFGAPPRPEQGDALPLPLALPLGLC